MIIVNVKFLKAEVNNFTRDELTINLHFDDGEKRVIAKTGKIDNPEEFISSIFSFIRKFEKENNQNLASDELFDTVVVRFENEDKTEDKLKFFINKVAGKLKDLRSKTQADGYLGYVNEIKRMELIF